MQFLDALLSILITKADAALPAGERHAIDHLILARAVMRAGSPGPSAELIAALSRDIELLERGPQPPKPCCGDGAARFGGQP